MTDRRAQGTQYPGVRRTHADIAMWRADAKIEQDRFAILFLQSPGIGPEFGNASAAAHRAVDRKQA